jgi:ribose-phosphate pyrophosphokinase
MPFSRQDRRVNEGESNSIRVLASVISSLNLSIVFTMDLHSNVFELSVSDKVEVINAPPEEFCNLIIENYFEYQSGNIALISPDQGASKKTIKCAEVIEEVTELNVPVIQCLKSRDTKNGNVSKLDIFLEEGTDYSKYDLWVVDDICDGGATFISIANKLRGKGVTFNSLNLYTTHGIYSKGKAALLEVYNQVICKNRVGNYPD